MSQAQPTIVPMNDTLAREVPRLLTYFVEKAMRCTPEEEDRLVGEDPHKYYVETGGALFFALQNEQTVGMVAVRNLGGGDYEFAKLVVLEEARGRGLGHALVQRCIEFVREQEGKRLYLQSSRVLKVALYMYEKMGFVETEPPAGMEVLDRTEVVMVMEIK